MNKSEQALEAGEIVEVTGLERWQVYQRLRELEIPCWCATGQPLRVEIRTPAAAALLWSVFRQLQAPRREQISWLEHCWRKKC